MMEFVLTLQACALCTEVPVKYFDDWHKCFQERRVIDATSNHGPTKLQRIRYGYIEGKLVYKNYRISFPVYRCTETDMFNYTTYNMKPPKRLKK